MMYQPIDTSHIRLERHTAQADRWCILRTSGGQTLKLADWLVDHGFDAWTPRRTFKRPKPGKCEMIDGRKPTIEIDAPILPTIVFAPAVHVQELAVLAVDRASQHPGFSLFTHAGRTPEVADREIEGLRQAEADATSLIERLRATEDREERRRIRAEAANNDRERLKALRSERRDFEVGEAVTVNDARFLAGMTGVVESSDGRTAMIQLGLFGGAYAVEVEAWQIVRHGVQRARSVNEAAK